MSEAASKIPIRYQTLMFGISWFLEVAFYAGKLKAQGDDIWEQHASNFSKEPQVGEVPSPDREAFCNAVRGRDQVAQSFFEIYQCARASDCLYAGSSNKSGDCKICRFVRHHTEVNMEGGMFVGYYPKVERIVLQALATGRLNKDALNEKILVSGDSEQADALPFHPRHAHAAPGRAAAARFGLVGDPPGDQRRSERSLCARARQARAAPVRSVSRVVTESTLFLRQIVRSATPSLRAMKPKMDLVN